MAAALTSTLVSESYIQLMEQQIKESGEFIAMLNDEQKLIEDVDFVSFCFKFGRMYPDQILTPDPHHFVPRVELLSKKLPELAVRLFQLITKQVNLCKTLNIGRDAPTVDGIPNMTNPNVGVPDILKVLPNMVLIIYGNRRRRFVPSEEQWIMAREDATTGGNKFDFGFIPPKITDTFESVFLIDPIRTIINKEITPEAIELLGIDCICILDWIFPIMQSYVVFLEETGVEGLEKISASLMQLDVILSYLSSKALFIQSKTAIDLLQKLYSNYYALSFAVAKVDSSIILMSPYLTGFESICDEIEKFSSMNLITQQEKKEQIESIIATYYSNIYNIPWFQDSNLDEKEHIQKIREQLNQVFRSRGLTEYLDYFMLENNAE